MELSLADRIETLYAGLCDHAFIRELTGSVCCCSDLSHAVFDLFLHCALLSDNEAKFEFHAKLEERLHYFHVKFPRLPIVFMPTALEFFGEKSLLPIFMSGPLFNKSADKNSQGGEAALLIDQLHAEFTLDRNTTVWRTFQTHKTKNVPANGMQNLSCMPNPSESVQFFRSLFTDQPRIITAGEATVNRGLCMRVIKLSMSYFTPDATAAVNDVAWQPPPMDLMPKKNVAPLFLAAGNTPNSHPIYAETPSSPPPEEQGMDISAPTSPEGPASPPPEDQGLDHHSVSPGVVDNSKRSHVMDTESLDRQSKRSKLDQTVTQQPLLPDNAAGSLAVPATSGSSPLKQLLSNRMQSSYHYLAMHLLTQLDMEFDEFYPIFGDISEVTCHFRTLFYGESHARIVNAVEYNSMYMHVMMLISEATGLKCTHLLIPVLRHLLIAHTLYWDATRDAATSDKYKTKLFSSVMLSRIIEYGCPERPVPIHMLLQTVEPRAKAVVLKLLWSLLQTWPTPVVAVGGIHAVPEMPANEQNSKSFYRLQMATGLTPAAHAEFRRVLASVTHQLRALLLKRGLSDAQLKSLAAMFFASKTGLLTSPLVPL